MLCKCVYSSYGRGSHYCGLMCGTSHKNYVALRCAVCRHHVLSCVFTQLTDCHETFDVSCATIFCTTIVFFNSMMLVMWIWWWYWHYWIHDRQILCDDSFHFIPVACAECDNSLPFSGASSIPLCSVLFLTTLLHHLFFHPLSPHLAIYFLVYLSVLFPNSYIIPFWEFYFLPFSVRAQTNIIYLTLLSLLRQVFNTCIKFFIG